MTQLKDDADAAQLSDSDNSGEDVQSDVTRKKRRETKQKKKKEHHHRNGFNQPTRDGQSNFKAFTGQRIAQPSGKAGGA